MLGAGRMEGLGLYWLGRMVRFGWEEGKGESSVIEEGREGQSARVGSQSLARRQRGGHWKVSWSQTGHGPKMAQAMEPLGKSLGVGQKGSEKK
jgi:hypothetical protein